MTIEYLDLPKEMWILIKRSIKRGFLNYHYKKLSQLNQRDVFGNTPLHLASNENSTELVLSNKDVKLI